MFNADEYDFVYMRLDCGQVNTFLPLKTPNGAGWQLVTVTAGGDRSPYVVWARKKEGQAYR